jgi:hypothetical protein
MRASLLAAILALSLPFAANAQPVSEATGPDTYLLVHLGALIPQGDIDQLDAGYAFGGAFGARLTPNLSVEGGLAYTRASRDFFGTFADVPISASLVARMPFKRAELAVYLGPTLHMARLTRDGVPSSTSRATAFGVHCGARASFNIWPTTLVGLDVRGDIAKGRFDGISTRIDGVRVAVTLQYKF